MPLYEITSPSGQVLEIQGARIPTESELQEIFAKLTPQEAEPERRRGANAPNNSIPGVDTILGGVDAAGSIAHNILAETIAGIAGIQSTSLVGPENAGSVVKGVRELLNKQPISESGKEIQSNIGEIVSPVGDAFNDLENTLGDAAFEATGSPALAAAAKSSPTLVTELLGIGLAKGGFKAADNIATSKETKSINRAISEAAPSTEQLKSTSREIYKEIDELGVTINPNAYQNLVKKISTELQKNGLDAQITPKSTAVLNRLQQEIGKDLQVSDIDTLRKVANSAASSTEAAEKALGSIVINSIDDFLDNAGNGALVGNNVQDVGKRYKAARDLWGRARRSELLDSAVDKARTQASGFENGIRTQFRQILNNKKQSKFFTKDEITEIKKVVNGSKGANIARLFGKLGFTDGQTTNIIGGALGAGLGGTVGGGVGAFVVPLVGVASKKLAERLTKGNAQFANDIIRAGSDANKIVRAYNKNTPPKLRDADELSQLLLRNDIDLSKIPTGKNVKEAARLASERRAALSSGAISGSAVSQSQEK